MRTPHYESFNLPPRIARIWLGTFYGGVGRQDGADRAVAAGGGFRFVGQFGAQLLQNKQRRFAFQPARLGAVERPHILDQRQPWKKRDHIPHERPTGSSGHTPFGVWPAGLFVAIMGNMKVAMKLKLANPSTRCRVILALLALAALPLRATTYQWTNPQGGSWTTTNWSPSGVPGAGDKAYITTAGTYTVFVTNSSATVLAAALAIGGAGTPTVVVDNYAAMSISNCTVAAGGVLVAGNSWMSGALTVQAGGRLNLAASNDCDIYSLILTNTGTVTWSSGALICGGTQIYNRGLWQITGNNSTDYGGDAQPVWFNTGTVFKSGGTGT